MFSDERNPKSTLPIKEEIGWEIFILSETCHIREIESLKISSMALQKVALWYEVSFDRPKNHGR